MVGPVTIAYSHVIAGVPLTVLGDSPVATMDPLTPPPMLSPPTLPPDSPECVTRYAQYLKDRYNSVSTLPDGDWPPSLGRQYTRLAMIERERELPGTELVATMEREYIHGNIDNIIKRKKAIELSEIFLPTEDGRQQLKILMDGAPGVGKSTLSRKVCKDWASGEFLQQYHLVILLPLRQARIREATSVEGLIAADDPDLKHQIVQHIRRTSGEHVLLIMDGYDELSYEDRTQNSLFLDIIQGHQFPNSSVLVTSRPYASDYLQQLPSVNRHVEVLGFTEKQMEDCIMKNIPDKAKATELLQALKERQDIASLCYIPLNCAIVLYVYKMEQCTLPHSLTKLYEIFILNAVKRHAKIIGENDPKIIKRLHTLATLPEPLQKQLSALSKLAYDGLVTDKMVFDINDLETALFPDCSIYFDTDIHLLGLMTAFNLFTSTGEEVRYQFLHLTIQEFLAAKWAASKLSPDEMFKFFQDHLREERYRTVLLFLAGMSQLNFPSAEDLFSHNLNLENQNFSEYISTKKVNYFFFLAHLIYQSQNLHLYRNLARALEGAQLSAAGYSISPFDCLVLANFLAWCDCSLKLLNLDNCGLTSQSLETLHRVNLEHCGTTRIEEVDLSHNPEVMTKLTLLPKLPMFEHTRKLTICGLQCPEGVSPDQVELHCLLNMQHLTMLKISEKELSDSTKKGFFLLFDKFVLQLQNVSIDTPVDIFRSLEHNTSVEELDLSRNRQLAEGDSEAVGCAIERMLNVNRTLKVLNLSYCGLDAVMAIHIAACLAHNASLTELNIGKNYSSITSEGWVHLFKALCNNISLKKLDISYNNLEMEGSLALAEMLSRNKSLTELNVSWCHIPEVGLREIATALVHNTSLKKLDISHNNLEMLEGSLAEMLSCNKSIMELNLSTFCHIPEAGLRELARGLFHNTSLQTLRLGGNDQNRTVLEAEIKRLNRSGNVTSQNSKDHVLAVIRKFK